MATFKGRLDTLFEIRLQGVQIRNQSAQVQIDLGGVREIRDAAVLVHVVVRQIVPEADIIVLEVRLGPAPRPSGETELSLQLDENHWELSSSQFAENAMSKASSHKFLREPDHLQIGKYEIQRRTLPRKEKRPRTTLLWGLPFAGAALWLFLKRR